MRNLFQRSSQLLMVFTFNIGIGMTAGLFLFHFSNYFQAGQRGARRGVGARWSLTVSVSESVLEAVRQFIRNQEKHHREKTFAEEYREFLAMHSL